MKKQKKTLKTLIFIAILVALIITYCLIAYLKNKTDVLNTTLEKNILEQNELIYGTNKKQIPNGIETVSMDLIPTGYTSFNETATLYFSFEIEGELKEIELNLNEFNIASNIFDYKDEVIFKLTFGINNLEVYECQILDFYTNEIITNLSEANIERLFNIESGKEIQKIDYTPEINFSKLQENTIYEIVSSVDDTSVPKFKNDLPDNYILYTKASFSVHEDVYERNIVMGNYKIDSNAVSFSMPSTFAAGESIRFMIKEIDTEKLLKLLPDNEIIKLSEYNSGDKIDDNFEEYIYNDTDNQIRLQTKEKSYNNGEERKTYILEPKKIYEYDWKIDEVYVEF